MCFFMIFYRYICVYGDIFLLEYHRKPTFITSEINAKYNRRTNIFRFGHMWWSHCGKFYLQGNDKICSSSLVRLVHWVAKKKKKKYLYLTVYDKNMVPKYFLPIVPRDLDFIKKKHRWVSKFSYVTLFKSYASYFFWKFLQTHILQKQVIL